MMSLRSARRDVVARPTGLSDRRCSHRNRSNRADVLPWVPIFAGMSGIGQSAVAGTFGLMSRKSGTTALYWVM